MEENPFYFLRDILFSYDLYHAIWFLYDWQSVNNKAYVDITLSKRDLATMVSELVY